MGFPIAAIAGAAIPAVASLIGGERRNVQQREEAQKNRDFQERMSSTAYQRAVHDMKMAGLNPMLAFQQGGASSPSGSMATIDDTIGPAVSTAMHSVRLRKEIQLLNAQIGVASADWYQKMQAGNVSKANADILSFGREVTGKDGVRNIVPYAAQSRRLQTLIEQFQTQILEQQLRGLKYDMPARKILGSSAGAYLRMMFGASGAVPGLGPIMR